MMVPDPVRRPAPPPSCVQHPAWQGPARGIRGSGGLLRMSCGGARVADAAVHVVDQEVVRVDAAPPAGLADGCQDGVVVGAGMALATTFRVETLGRRGRSASLLWHFPPMRMNVNRCVISRRSRLTNRHSGGMYLPEIRRLTLAWRLRTLRFRPTGVRVEALGR